MLTPFGPIQPKKDDGYFTPKEEKNDLVSDFGLDEKLPDYLKNYQGKEEEVLVVADEWLRQSLLAVQSQLANQQAKSSAKNYKTETANEKEQKVANDILSFKPDYPISLKAGFFVDVLNCGGYSINGKNVPIPPAQMPMEFKRNNKDFSEYLDSMKKKFNINDQKNIKFQFKDKTTEQAINEDNTSKIALNFANAHCAGGGPGFHKDPDTKLFVYGAPSAKAQEESLCQRTDLMASLTQLPHTLKADCPNFIRSCYEKKLDSQQEAYISFNYLFAVQGKDFYQSCYLEEPKAVIFITSAAANYGYEEVIDCSKNSEAYKNAKQRIETHLLAASSAAYLICKLDKPVECILGAWGCGEFAPKKNPDEYRKMIADIYKDLLPKLQGIFDVITFAVPSFGNRKDANHNIFKDMINAL